MCIPLLVKSYIVVHRERTLKTDTEQNILLNRVIIFVLFVHKNNEGWTTDFTWTTSMMSLLPFWVLNVVVPLLSMQGQKALGFHQTYLNLCSEDEFHSLLGLEQPEGE